MSRKVQIEYNCESCLYKCSNKRDFNKHLLTKGMGSYVYNKSKKYLDLTSGGGCLLLGHNNKIFKRSIYAIRDIKKGERFSENNIKTYRPYNGLGAEYFLKLINKKSPVNISANNVLKKRILKLIK